MRNEIVLKSVYGPNEKQMFFMNPSPNPRTGRLPECVKTVNSNGDMILTQEELEKQSKGLAHYIPADKVFIIAHGKTFNLDDVVDKAEWEAIQWCSMIAHDRFQRDDNGVLVIDGDKKKYGTAELYVEHPDKITVTKMNKKQLIYNACKYIYEESEADRIKKARVLGRNLSNAIPADVLDFLIEQAEKNPQKIIDLYEGDDWKMYLLVEVAVERGVIRKIAGAYVYDEKTLGHSLESTLLTLKDIRNKAILNSIKKETYPELLPKQEIQEIKDNLLTGTPEGNVAPAAKPGKK